MLYNKWIFYCIYFNCFLLSISKTTNHSISFISFHKDFSAIDRIMIQILKYCYTDLKTIIIYDEDNTNIVKDIKFMKPINIILQNSSITSQKIRSRNQVDSLIIAVKSEEELNNTLTLHKKVKQWNIMVPLFILNRDIGGCACAQNFLELSWQMEIVSAFLICFNWRKEPMIYTYNPYADCAPYSWNIFMNTTEKNSSELTFYRRAYKAENICNDLKFDRTRYLNGTEIKMAAGLWTSDPIYVSTDRYIIKNKMIPFHANIVDAIRDGLKIKPKYKVNVLQYSNGFQFFEDLENGKFDISITPEDSIVGTAYSITYPVQHYKEFILSHYQGYLSPIEKMFNFYGVWVFMFTLIIITLTFIMIFFKKKKSIAFSIFEILRLITNTALRIDMNSLSLKIFFLMVLFYFLIINATFQGHISSFLTKSEMKKNADCLEDLAEPGFGSIYADNPMRPLIQNTSLEEKTVYNTVHCLEYIKKNNSIACIDNFYETLKTATKYNLHLSKNPVRVVDFILITRKNWPLKSRVNQVLMWLAHAGLSKRWTESITVEYILLQRRREARSAVDFRPITLDSLKFAMLFLIIGLSLSLVCFLLEKVLYQRYFSCNIIIS